MIFRRSLYRPAVVVRKMSVFTGHADKHRGVVVKSTALADEENSSPTEFGAKLTRSLIKWSADEQVRLVWFRVARQQAHWITDLARNDFLFHRTSPDGNELWMYKRLRGENTTVDSPHTYAGAGGLVIRDGRLLVVKEHSIPFWKLPGGYVNPGENIGDAAIREVFEETGVKTEFVSLVAFRHVLNSSFDCADMYFVTNLRPLTTDIVIDKEILDAKWMKCEDFLTSSDVGEHSRFFVKTFFENAKNGVEMKQNKMIHQFTKKEFLSYIPSLSNDVHERAS